MPCPQYNLYFCASLHQVLGLMSLLLNHHDTWFLKHTIQACANIRWRKGLLQKICESSLQGFAALTVIAMRDRLHKRCGVFAGAASWWSVLLWVLLGSVVGAGMAASWRTDCYAGHLRELLSSKGTRPGHSHHQVVHSPSPALIVATLLHTSPVGSNAG